jgi:hypothetical protein
MSNIELLLEKLCNCSRLSSCHPTGCREEKQEEERKEEEENKNDKVNPCSV